MKIINLIHLGIGKVGRELVRQIYQREDHLKKQFSLDIKYCGLYNSRGGIYNKNGLTFEEMRDFPFRLNSTIPNIIKEIDKSTILIDTTASDKTGNIIELTLRNGGYVVISNKKPLSDSQSKFDLLEKLGRNRFLYETTVGAGLPIINTLKAMIATGDEIETIEGCFSGTLGFIFSSLEDGLSFSQSVKLAKEKGFTEPDPRDDLKGLDVARKALILARLMGIKLELSQIKLEKLYPPSMENLSTDEFMEKISSQDQEFKTKMDKARKNGKTLRYVASISKDHCKVSLKEVFINEDIGNLKGPDNIIVIKSKRYSDRPLIIKGPGAGIKVTAAGVFTDILRIGGVV